MTDSIHDYMKVGIVQFMIYPECFGGAGPQVETVTSLCNNQWFDFLEIGPIIDPKIRREVKKILSQAAVEPVFDGQPQTLIPGLNLGSESDVKRTKAINAMKEAIDQAAFFGSKTCGVMSGKSYPKGLDISKATDLLIESLKELCEYAKPMDITLCLENFDRIPYSKDCLIGPTPEAAILSERIRSDYDNFGLLIDLSHTPIMNESPSFMVKSAGKNIIRTQIGNGSSNPYSAHYGDNHAYFGAPKTGVSIKDLADFLRSLLEIGYLSKNNKGYVGFEVKPLASESSEAIIAGSIRSLKTAWSMV